MKYTGKTGDKQVCIDEEPSTKVSRFKKPEQRKRNSLHVRKYLKQEKRLKKTNKSRIIRYLRFRRRRVDPFASLPC